MTDDAAFAARMREKRGLPPLRRMPTWQQLMDISIANLEEVIARPGVMDDNGEIVESIGVRLLKSSMEREGDGRKRIIRSSTSFSVLTASGSEYTQQSAARALTRVNTTSSETGTSIAWVLTGEQPQGFTTVEFKVHDYEAMVRRISAERLSCEDAINEWLKVIERGLVVQHIHPHWRPQDRSTVSWCVDRVEDMVDEGRAVFTLSKRQSWIDMFGQLATPWGSINCASAPPTIINGSVLDMTIETNNALRASGVKQPPVPITEGVWWSGLKMPPYDHERVGRILAAQTLVVEVPLVA